MDVIEKFSGLFCNECLPKIDYGLQIAYTISMVSIAVKSADANWHKANLFYSYLKALLYVRGADIILALCVGGSPIDAIANNCTLYTTAAVWWLMLFVPFDIFNKVLNIEVGDFKPLIVLVTLMASLRRVVAVDNAVKASLESRPGSYICVLVGTLAGNGCLVLASVFGDFSKAVSSQKMTRLAFLTAMIVGISAVCCKSISPCVALTASAVLVLLMEVVECAGHQVVIFDPIYELIRKVVVTCDLVE